MGRKGKHISGHNNFDPIGVDLPLYITNKTAFGFSGIVNSKMRLPLTDYIPVVNVLNRANNDTELANAHSSYYLKPDRFAKTLCNALKKVH